MALEREFVAAGGPADRIGSIAPGKNANLVVVKGAPSRHITDIENVRYVFNDGDSYELVKVTASGAGDYRRN